MKKDIIGILGGMGPEATADLFMKVLKNTPAIKDQDHLRVIIDSNTQIPDRTAAILGKGPSPVAILKETAENLIKAGVEVIIMPCNTAHYFYSDFATDLAVPFLHMMEETVNYIKANYPNVKRVGLLATTGTIQTILYKKALDAAGLEQITPDDEMQEAVMEAIYSSEGIKAGHYHQPGQTLQQVGEHLVAKGAQAVIMGCTEIPLALSEGALSVPILDATNILALAAVKFATTDNE